MEASCGPRDFFIEASLDSRHLSLIMRLIVAAVFLGIWAGLKAAEPSPYHLELEKSKPIAWWRFEKVTPAKNVGSTDGPTAPTYPLFAKKNPALQLSSGGYLVVPDLGENSIYDFTNGDEITMEAMVNPAALHTQAVILSKGRTHNKGFSTTNQNWAFRLKAVGSRAGINFLFHSRASEGKKGDWHRWTSTSGFGVDTGWHHVAISYRFGDPESIRGFIDGKEVKGKWDKGGHTKVPPVMDNDELWIGSALQGLRNSSFVGSLDEIALHRRIVPPGELKTRYQYVEPPLILPEATPGVLELTLHAPMSDHNSFPNEPKPAVARWQQSALGFVRVPRKFDDWGVREDWGTAAMVRGVAEIELPAGEYQFLARSRGIARLFVDQKEILSISRPKRGGGAHNKVQPIPEVPRPGMRPPAMDDVEKIVSFSSPGGKHTVVFDVMLGGPRLRLEFGEAAVALARKGEMFRLAGPKLGPELTDAGWEAFAARTAAKLDALDRRARRSADQQSDYWNERHQIAANHLVSNPGNEQSIDSLVSARISRVSQTAGDPDSFFNREVRPIFSDHCYRCHGEKEKGGLNLQNQDNILRGGESELPAVVPQQPHQSFLLEVVSADAGDLKMPPKGDGLTEKEIAVLKKWITQGGKLDPAPVRIAAIPPLVDDLAFLRRVWIDTVGVAPPLDVVKSFRDDPDPGKRRAMIQKVLSDDRWADNWVGYWQDVLAENPNLLKPNLNNTGPFRYWILESFRDNKPMDRFATELITMRGSTWGGGPAGFSVASQNDVPMAAKAHILGTAFLGVDMKCARCHDAPYHETTQQDLFAVAAMLKRSDIKVPQTSSVPATFFEHVENGGRESLIQVSLEIGATVKPNWPFHEFSKEIPDRIIRDKTDSRERIAAEITFTRRFAEVMTNRIWKRFMGAGLVEKVDDWEGKKPSDPDLLAYLTDRFIANGYDVKSLASLILSSQTYQRAALDAPENLEESDRYFEGPYRRRMSAEQVVDNAWHVAGKTMDLGQLTMDMEGRLAPDYFLHFGRPKRAWEFTTLANERDRPSLAMPKIQAVVDVLLAFGWRNSRQDPTSQRIEDPNPLQPGVLANGVMGGWLTRLTDDSETTRLCIEAKTVEQLVEDLFLRYLTRLPTEQEKAQFNDLLSDGFADRVIPAQEAGPPPEKKRFPYVSWSNHLDGEANSIKQEEEEFARQGDPPTRFLRPAWRESVEDAVWALLNAPEMIMIP